MKNKGDLGYKSHFTAWLCTDLLGGLTVLRQIISRAGLAGNGEKVWNFGRGGDGEGDRNRNGV